ncbi:hypothetical protein AGABI2DRAFT_187264 [Agaricus bisporus var. bisporus H97]|uniref:hypothetical protein n=1 Tax=Agaricus bisporus var. bisporus (strain H97 / ATCC MYA-4626 / FGSC 10389) TaxID=936046 RepID=UPI00029F6204|nr:hypothetical protein AGABI2DRAFT_187264 [Agaricus bisporus var. bisporus H97]EKV44457.1 hypothetical protein AGABI2DRAFT_187264 [Agaricus bisporus var. bisporus H97]
MSSPTTPVSRRTWPESHRPLNSSPLVSPSPCRRKESLFEHRRSQFKSQTPTTTSSLFRNPSLPPSLSSSRTRLTTPSTTRTRPFSHIGSSGRTTRSLPGFNSTTPSSIGTYSPFKHPEDPQKQLLRERLKAKCLDRVEKARARAVKKRRYTGYSDRSSDGFDADEEEDKMDEEDEEDDDAIMGDELFRRIMLQTDRKIDHQFRLSYAQEVGSSFDPDIEDVNEWENLIQDNRQQNVIPEENIDDFDDDELEAYAEECARQAALDEWADIPEEDLFQLPSDLDDTLEDSKARDDMDVS